MLMLLPGFFIGKIGKWIKCGDRATVSNISTEEGGSFTAVLTLMFRSQMTLMNAGGPDSLAPLLMKNKSILGGVFGSVWGGCLWSRAYLFLQRINFYLTGRNLLEQTARWEPHEPMGGGCTYLQCRTCWLDDCVEAFLRLHTGKQTNLVILGAGYDSRCYRLPHLENTAMYEVDASGSQAEKLKSLKAAGIDPGRTVFVSCDFQTQDWLKKLHASGFDGALPTLLVWEGVTMYLPEEIVAATLARVVELGEGSCIGFDYFDRTWALSPTLQNKTKSTGEPLIFGLTGHEPEELVASRNLFMLDHLKVEELVDRYVAKHCDGRAFGHIGDFGGFVLAGNFEMQEKKQKEADQVCIDNPAAVSDIKLEEMDEQ